MAGDARWPCRRARAFPGKFQEMRMNRVSRMGAALGLGVVLAAGVGCGHKEEKPAGPPPAAAVVVTPVVQRDVPVYQEWIGTTQGNINAEIRPQVDGILLRRVYAEGGFVHQ